MVTIENLTFSYGPRVIIDNFFYTFEQGKFYSILGPSGCGKTTFLNLIVGLIKPNSGKVIVKDPAALISFMMHQDVLLPWRTVAENISLIGEVLERVTPQMIMQAFLRDFGLEKCRDYYPSNISAGMKQRVIMVQSLIQNPQILLLDEPFSNIDFDLKLKIQTNLAKHIRDTNTTTIMVTHDIEDAIALSDKVLILSASPIRIKKIIDISLEKENQEILRKSKKIRDYFVEIWNELKAND